MTIDTVQKINFAKVLFFLSFVFAFATLAVQVVVTNRFAVKGNELAQLITEKDTLEKNVSRLELNKATQSSLAVLDSRARQLGFVEATEHVTPIKPSTVASLTKF